MTYKISNEELHAMHNEVLQSSVSVSVINFSRDQALSLVEEVLASRRLASGKLESNQQIDLFDISSVMTD